MGDSRPRAVELIAPALTLAGMIATPLLRPRGDGRRRAAGLVIAGLGATTAMATARRAGAARTTAAAVSIAGLTGALERIGTSTGRPFGAYRYTRALRPQIDGVPLIVPVAWFAMAVPAREAAHRALGARSSAATRLVAGAAALTAWDLFLDPQMVGEGYWVWARRGRYRGIPLSNFAGWFLTAVVVMAVLEVTVPIADEPDVAGDALTAIYVGMTAMETLGFAAFFRDRMVAAVGGAAMGSFAVPALARRLWHAS